MGIGSGARVRAKQLTYIYFSNTGIHTAYGVSDTQSGGSVAVTCSSGDSMCSPSLTGLTGDPSVTNTSMHI